MSLPMRNALRVVVGDKICGGVFRTFPEAVDHAHIQTKGGHTAEIWRCTKVTELDLEEDGD